MKQDRPGKFVSSSKTAAVVNKFYCNAKSFQCTGERSSLSCKWFWALRSQMHVRILWWDKIKSLFKVHLGMQM